MSLGIDAMTRMLNRLRPIREIQEAHLTAAQIPTPAAYYNWSETEAGDAHAVICAKIDMRLSVASVPYWLYHYIWRYRFVPEEYGNASMGNVYRLLDTDVDFSWCVDGHAYNFWQLYEQANVEQLLLIP